jgi:very-short-patch-repair endonuclease
MRNAHAYRHYRRDLATHARILRRDPTPAERKLWCEFLQHHPCKFCRQKPLGSYIADFYCAQKQLVIELEEDDVFTMQREPYARRRTEVLAFQRIHVLRFTNREVMLHFDAVCAQIEEATAPATLSMPG